MYRHIRSSVHALLSDRYNEIAYKLMLLSMTTGALSIDDPDRL
jgi:hypothetical protein